MIRVLISGEGANEIGSGTAGRNSGSGTGVVEELLAKVRVGGFDIRSRVVWKDVHKLRVHVPGEGEEKTVRGLGLMETEHGCHGLVFLRDRDGEFSRERTIERASLAEQKRRPALRIAWGVPVEMLECWLLALVGEAQSEHAHDPVAALSSRHNIPPKRTTAMVQLVRSATLLTAPGDAVSLWRWLRRAATALNVRIPKQWP